MDKEKVYNEAVGGDEGFAAGDGYPSCDGEPCANVTDESSADADTMAGDRNTPKAASEELPSRDWEAEIAEWQDKYLRLQAEFDNFRKRTLREKMELVQSGSAECVKNFLPLMDDLQRALEAIGLDGKILEKPNDILGLEYCKALLQMESRIQPLALLREGDYHAEKADPDNPSATSLRTRLLSGEDLSPFAPQTAMEAYRSARQYALSSGERAMLAGLRLLSDEAWQQTAHGSEGLWSKAMKAAREKGSLEEIIGAAKSRRYPRTRIQRLLLCAFLKISQEDLQLPVCHVRALAFDETGKALLRRMRAEGQLPVVNAGEKPPASALFDLEVRAGRLYPLFCRSGTVPDGNAELNCRIFLKK